MGAVQQALLSYAIGVSDPFFSSVVLLVHFDGANGAAISNVVYPTRGNTITGAQPTVTTTAPLFGTACDFYNGTGGNLSVATGGWYTFGTGDFSIEVAMKTASPTQTSSAIIDMRTSSNATVAPAIFIQAGTFYIETDGATWSLASVGSVATSTWQRLGLFRVSSVTYFFVDGILLGSFADTHNYGALNIAVGSGWSTGANFTGYTDELRVTQGVGRHSANYTVDAAAFPDS
jgi:hypothetical protein